MIRKCASQTADASFRVSVSERFRPLACYSLAPLEIPALIENIATYLRLM